MVQRLVLGLMLIAAGVVAGWQLRATMAVNDCRAAGGVWSPPGVCAGLP